MIDTSLIQQLSGIEFFFLAIVTLVIVGKIAQLASLKVLGKSIKKTEGELDEIFVEELHKPLYITLLSLGIYLLADLQFQLGNFEFYIKGVSFSLITIIWGRFFIRMGSEFFEIVKTSRKFDTEFAPIFENLWTFSVLLGITFSILSIWNIDITPLLASAGIAGIAIGFAAKDTISNFFGGLSLYFDNTYKIGDYIEIETGEQGRVQEIGVRSTTIKTRDSIMITIPNSVLNTAKIYNESAPDETKRIHTTIGVEYGVDPQEIEDILLDAADEVDLVEDYPESDVLLTEFGDSAIEFELRSWVAEPTNDRIAQDKINRSVYRKLKENSIEIPFPQRDVNMKEK